MFITGVISPAQKKWNRRLPTSPYTEWQEKKLQIKFGQVRERICLSPQGVKLGASKDWYGFYMDWNYKLHSFRAQRYQKYALFQEKLQMIVVQNWILYKKFTSSESIFQLQYDRSTEIEFYKIVKISIFFNRI